jgi:hypothetical protein
MYVIQHFFISRPSGSPVSEDAGIEPRTAATLALTARDTLTTPLALIHTRLGLIRNRLDLILTWQDLTDTRLDLI